MIVTNLLHIRRAPKVLTQISEKIYFNNANIYLALYCISQILVPLFICSTVVFITEKFHLLNSFCSVGDDTERYPGGRKAAHSENIFYWWVYVYTTICTLFMCFLAMKIIKNVTYSVSNFGVVKIVIWQIVTRWKVCHARKFENLETI